MPDPALIANLDQQLAALDENAEAFYVALAELRQAASNAATLFAGLGLDPIAVQAMVIAHALAGLEG